MSPRIERAHSAHNPRPEGETAPAARDAASSSDVHDAARTSEEHAEACERRFAQNIIEAYQQWVADGRPDRR